MKRIGILGGMILALASTVCVAAQDDRWLHVRVEEQGREAEKVIVNLPLQLVESVLPAIEVDEFHRGKIRIEDAELDGIDLREIFEALQSSPDANYVTVQGEDGTVKVAKEQGFLIVRADERNGDRVRVRVPMTVVDALLSGAANELDLLAGLRALADHEGGDLITVESDDATVRVWIDSRQDVE